MDDRLSYKLVFLCTSGNVDNIKKYYGYYRHFIGYNKIVIIGPADVKSIVDGWEYNNIEYINEDQLYTELSYNNVKNLINERVVDGAAARRTGWYLQQFLKMAYATVCEEGNYLVWDADTLPLRNVHMVNEAGKNVFHVKTEYNKAYFDTMQRLVPDLIKKNNYSFIAEHMIINKDIMLKLIDEIEANKSLSGDSFWEKIIYAVDENELKGSGFSEFETYGTYVSERYPDRYVIAKWKSLREGTLFFGNRFTTEQAKMLSKKYDAVSFEKHDNHLKLSKLLNHKIFQNMFVIQIFEKLKLTGTKCIRKIRRYQ